MESTEMFGAWHRVYTPEEQENGQPASRMFVYDAVTGE